MFRIEINCNLETSNWKFESIWKSTAVRRAFKWTDIHIANIHHFTPHSVCLNAAMSSIQTEFRMIKMSANEYKSIWVVWRDENKCASHKCLTIDPYRMGQHVSPSHNDSCRKSVGMLQIHFDQSRWLAIQNSTSNGMPIIKNGKTLRMTAQASIIFPLQFHF